ncbi:hypothetical protein HHI36_005435 [Cryptolaemus montrouzieri]|uniref:C2H2-type domain-containing protein n=1 Tax=Cryptolaemus montrouzieri TaxID=559131 RepID=A0ABD2NU42_9CUCU
MDFPKIKVEPPEEHVDESKNFTEFVSMEEKIWNQESIAIYETYQSLQNDHHENMDICVKKEPELLEEENKITVKKLIDAKGKIWYKDASSQNSIKEEKVEENVSIEILEDYLNSESNLQRKYHKCSHCGYQTNQKSILKQHINAVHLGIKTTNVISVNIEHFDKVVLNYI